MDFSTPPELQTTLRRVRDIVEHQLIPLEPAFLQGEFTDLLPQLEAVREHVKAAGLWLPQMPVDEGGMGLSLTEFAQVSEELGRSILGHVAFNCQAPDAGNMEILHEHGTEPQKEAFLAPLLAGEVRSCFGMTEPENPGSNPTRLSTTATREGDAWVLNGRKWFTTGADGAAFCIVMAVTDPDAENKYARASMIMVPTDAEGYQLVRNLPVMGERGSGHASHAEISLTDCRVPADNLLGGRGMGFAIAQERLGPGRIHHCMRWVGICERVFGLMCDYAATRQMSSRGYLGDQQTVHNWIAESRAEIDAARLMVLHTAWRIEQQGAYAARTAVSTIKYYVAGVLQRVLDRALQAHGGLGMTDDTPIAWWFRHERAARIYDGPDEVHKTVVARHILREHGLDLRR